MKVPVGLSVLHPRRAHGKQSPGTKVLGPAECRITESSGAWADLAGVIEKSGGCIVGSYKEPLGGHPVVISILPIDAIEPTPFQRDLSDAHHKRLGDVTNKTFSLGKCHVRAARVFQECLKLARKELALGQI